jgi:hypothetical protein
VKLAVEPGPARDAVEVLSQGFGTHRFHLRDGQLQRLGDGAPDLEAGVVGHRRRAALRKHREPHRLPLARREPFAVELDVEVRDVLHIETLRATLP